MRGSLSVFTEILRLQIWVVPALSAILAGVAALSVVWLEDATTSLGLAIDIEPVSARALLSAVSSAMISFTGLVFTVTMLVLQLASSQLSPRVMRTFLRDRFNQSVLGLFVATFIFSLLMLASVKDDFVPQLGVIASIGLVLAAVLAFVAYIDHMAHAIRPTSVIGAIAAETRDAIDRNYAALDDAEEGPQDQPEPGDDAETGRAVRWARASGYIQAIDEERLLQHAAGQGRRVRLLAGIGDYIVRGAPIFTVHDGEGVADTVVSEGLADAIRVGPERTMSQDPGFGFRQLVDVALRALSPSLNDPTTANQVIDQLHDLLRHLLTREVSAPRRVRNEAGASIVIPAPDWDAFVVSAVDEIHHASASMPQVRAHLRAMLASLTDDASGGRQPAVRRALARFDGVSASDPT